MNVWLLIAAVIILACVVANKVSSRLGIPMLLAFILLGMFFGSDGPVKIAFDDYAFAEKICSTALIFIMFYGGFGTKWSEARPIAVKATVLSCLGTLLTAALVGLFCMWALKIPTLESFLIGAVISSTDAASVFSILRSRHLGLKYNTASLLEIESGSNDPFSYMFTVVVLALMSGGMSGGQFAYMLFSQLAYGVAGGIAVAVLALIFLKHFKFSSSGFDGIFLVAVALLAYALPAVFGGNGYLAVYITGIILGNRRLSNKKALVNFFDSLTGLMQMLLFFLLGLLSTPSNLPKIALTGLAIALFLTVFARPAAVFAILAPFRSKPNQMALVSWAGMRGAASIVFAIMAVTGSSNIANDIFSIVFFIVLFSILIQGSLLPLFARLVKMSDAEGDVMKTFNDYADEVPVQFIQLVLHAGHPWENKEIKSLNMPPDTILVLVLRGEKHIVPNGKTVLRADDVLILSGKSTDRLDGVNLYEKAVVAGDAADGKTLSEIVTKNKLVIMIRRGERVVIPRGSTQLKPGDLLVINEIEDPTALDA